ncbi:hypothetical protein H0H93_007422 [Arthromyces matolae]|nr:hypothetical protein H0H93_007422 [Arthromyces matolae]
MDSSLSSHNPPSGGIPSPMFMLDPALLESTVSAAVSAALGTNSVLANLSINTPLDDTLHQKRPAGQKDGQKSNNFGYTDYGRQYLRQANFFLYIDKIVSMGIQYESMDSDEDERPGNSISDKHHLNCWKKLCQILPNFKVDMLKLAGDVKERKSICRLITQGRNKARSDDTNSLNAAILTFIPLDAPNASIDPPLTSSSLKSLRGWAHPATAKKMCPVRYPATEDRGRSGNAAIAGLTSMTPEMVAYAAVQVRYTLSAATSWDPVDGPFKYADFYTSIISLFEDDEDRQAHLSHFNCVVFGSPDGVAVEETRVNDDSDIDNFAVAKQQRAQKRACRDHETDENAGPSN